MGVRIDSQFWESLFFEPLQQISQVLLTLAIFACLGLFFPRNYYSGLFHHLYTGLSNGGRINDGRVVVRSVSVHSSANAASGLGPTCEFGFATHLPHHAEALHRH